jgi:hypothetical protein
MYLREFLDKAKNLFGAQFLIPKIHWLLHLIEDLERFGCHLEYMSAYKYENRYRDFKTYFRSGNKTLEQLEYVF